MAGDAGVVVSPLELSLGLMPGRASTRTGDSVNNLMAWGLLSCEQQGSYPYCAPQPGRLRSSRVGRVVSLGQALVPSLPAHWEEGAVGWKWPWKLPLSTRRQTELGVPAHHYG